MTSPFKVLYRSTGGFCLNLELASLRLTLRLKKCWEALGHPDRGSIVEVTIGCS